MCVADNTDFDNFRADFAEQLPGSNIEVTGKGETIVLTGTAKDSAQVKRAGALAQTRAKTVVNMVTAPPDRRTAPDRPAGQVLRASTAPRSAQLGFNLFSTQSQSASANSPPSSFKSPRFSQLQPTGTQTRVNFADLLNLFVYRPDLNIGATIKALQERDVLQILAEPNLITVEGKTASFLAGGSFPFPVLTTTSTGGSVSPVITVQFKPFGVQARFHAHRYGHWRHRSAGFARSQFARFLQCRHAAGLPDPRALAAPRRYRSDSADGESFVIAGLIDNRVVQEIVESSRAWAISRSSDSCSAAAPRRRPTRNCWC